MISDVVITCIIPFCNKSAFVLFDPGSILSYVSKYFAYCFDIVCDHLAMLLHIFTSVGDSLVVD